MGEEMESTDIKEATGDEVTNKTCRKRKRQLYQSILNLMEFYFSDANLLKSRFLNQLIAENGCVDLATLLSFNKLRALTTDAKDVIKAVKKSELIQVSEDGTKVFRTKPVQAKPDVDACTIYIEQIPPDADHDWLTEIFTVFGPVDYVSIPKFKNSSKNKGFAFVEFQDKQSASKALEAFGAKGCCLSPQMPPDQLVSIRTHEPESEAGSMPKSENFPDVGNNENQHGKDMENEIDKKSDTEHQQKKKRKLSENEDSQKEGSESEIGSEKIKRMKSKSVEIEITVENGYGGIKQDEIVSTNHKTENEKELDGKVGKNRNVKSNVKSLDDSSVDVTVNKEEKEKLKRKKCHSESSALEETPPKNRKKFKSENDTTYGEGIEESCEEKEEFQELQDDENDMEGDKKKKRKKKKKHKKGKLNIAYLGLHIMSKTEWKKLRNKYLEMQKKKMKALKNHLAYSKWEYNKNRQNATRSEEEVKTVETKEASAPALSFTPGVIIKVTLEHPAIDTKTAKTECRIHPEIKYVEVTEGREDVYLRTSSPEIAQQVLATKHWPNMELLQGEQEEAYWEKINKNKEKKFIKNNKSNQRGRDKLLKRAEKLHGKYINIVKGDVAGI